MSERRVILGVGAVVWNEAGEILLIRRTNPPLEGQWSLPGGRVDFGETLEQALRRELLEETGLEIEIFGLIDVAEIVGDPALPGAHYVLIDYAARGTGGTPVAGSDAAEARWFAAAELTALGLWSETRRIIALGAARYRQGAA